MSINISSSVRGKSWVFPVTALCIMLGMLLALALKTQRQAASEGIPNRWPAIRTEFRVIKDENEKLRKDVSYYKSREEELVGQQAQGVSTAKGLKQSLDESKALAGLVGVAGPGVVVTLRDSPQLNPAETNKDIIEKFMVHDSDLLAVCNELYNAGAEAVAINGERLIATSSIRCAGVSIMVNSRRVAPPFEIRAIGKPEALEEGLKTQGGAADMAGLWVLEMIEIDRKPNIAIPAYDGSTRFIYARPLQSPAKPKPRGER